MLNSIFNNIFHGLINYNFGFICPQLFEGPRKDKPDVQVLSDLNISCCALYLL